MTRGGKLTGGIRRLTRPTGSYACIFGGKINGDIDRPIDRANIEQSASGRWKADICNDRKGN